MSLCVRHNVSKDYPIKDTMHSVFSRPFIVVTIVAGKNIIPHLLGKGHKNLKEYKFIKRSQTKHGKSSTIICSKIYIDSYKCIKLDVLKFTDRLEVLYNRVCRNRKLDRSLEENSFSSEIEYRKILDYYLHGHHVKFLIGKGGKYIRYLKEKYKCQLYIHTNKNKHYIRQVGTTKLCININYKMLYKFLLDISTNILRYACYKIPRNISLFNFNKIDDNVKRIQEEKRLLLRKYIPLCASNPHCALGEWLFDFQRKKLLEEI